MFRLSRCQALFEEKKTLRPNEVFRENAMVATLCALQRKQLEISAEVIQLVAKNLEHMRDVNFDMRIFVRQTN
jgi:hypothetical protein